MYTNSNAHIHLYIRLEKIMEIPILKSIIKMPIPMGRRLIIHSLRTVREHIYQLEKGLLKEQ